MDYKQYTLQEFLSLDVDIQANYINSAYNNGVTDEDLREMFKCKSSSTYLRIIRDYYIKNRNLNIYIKKENNVVNKVIDNDIDKINIKEQLDSIKIEIDTIKQQLEVKDTTTNCLLTKLEEKGWAKYREDTVLNHLKINKNVVEEFNNFCNKYPISKVVLLGLALEEFVEKYSNNKTK